MNSIIGTAVLEEGVTAGIVGVRVDLYLVVHRHGEIRPHIGIEIAAGYWLRVVAPHVFFDGQTVLGELDPVNSGVLFSPVVKAGDFIRIFRFSLRVV